MVAQYGLRVAAQGGALDFVRERAGTGASCKERCNMRNRRTTPEPPHCRLAATATGPKPRAHALALGEFIKRTCRHVPVRFLLEPPLQHRRNGHGNGGRKLKWTFFGSSDCLGLDGESAQCAVALPAARDEVAAEADSATTPNFAQCAPSSSNMLRRTRILLLVLFLLRVALSSSMDP